ncbi:hypothetical protein KIN20_029089 [Parelaphostrongylus tenuis]|uniref:Uncharacterized protein n=1 Tax=Parelaphostrongylus tenuis TaxID=148309 RepID=A0AAD5R2L6_PARTN|nr:hypothetical protein KIN20_029089 [Parelaphostrongylus tenuis]
MLHYSSNHSHGYHRYVFSAAALATIQITVQICVRSSEGFDIERCDEAARKASIERFIGSQLHSLDDEISDNDDDENSPECYSKEFYDASPPQSTYQMFLPKHTVERDRSERVGNCDGDVPNEKRDRGHRFINDK